MRKVEHIVCAMYVSIKSIIRAQREMKEFLSPTSISHQQEYPE